RAPRGCGAAPPGPPPPPPQRPPTGRRHVPARATSWTPARAAPGGGSAGDRSFHALAVAGGAAAYLPDVSGRRDGLGPVRGGRRNAGAAGGPAGAGADRLSGGGDRTTPRAGASRRRPVLLRATHASRNRTAAGRVRLPDFPDPEPSIAPTAGLVADG